MATYAITFHQLLNNYAVVQTLTNNEVEVGQSITLTNAGSPFNGTFTVYALPQYLYIGADTAGDLNFDGAQPIPNQIMFACTGANVNRVAATGTITYNPVCTWISAADVKDWLGIAVASQLDDTFITSCAAAANQFAHRRRWEAGYYDSYSTVPGADCKLGVIQLAGAYYRARGSMDQFASFNEMGVAPTVGLSPVIKQLLGIDRPACA